MLTCILFFFFVCFNCSCHSVRTSCWNKRLLSYLLVHTYTEIYDGDFVGKPQEKDSSTFD